MDKEKMIEFTGEQCKIFPEDSEMGKYLRETLKMLQAEPCEDAVSRKGMYFKLTNGAYPNETIEQFIDRLVKELEAMPPVAPTQRWIPVSERLPEKDVEVLATTEWGEVTIAMYCVTDWLIHEGDTNAETDEIVAWMPLPKLYKTEMEGEE